MDEEGELIGLPYHYRDSRTDGQMEKVFAKVPRHEVFATTGIQFMQINTLFQLHSMVSARDPALERARTMLMTPDLFHYWLTGAKKSEYTIATTSQMVNARDRNWAGHMLDRIGIPTRILPPIVMPGTKLGDLSGKLTGEAGLTDTVPVIAVGSHDTASAVAAIPELDINSVYISSGTWSLMGVETARPVLNDKALKLNFTNEGGVAGTLRLLKNIMGLWLVQECQRQWEREGSAYSWDRLLAEGEKAAPFRSLVDPDAPDFLAPGDMPAAIRGWCKKTGQPEPASVGELVRCCLESLALKYRVILEDLESLVERKLTRIRIVGGGCLNRQLCQYTADACERPVKAGPVEATALGSIMLQAIATGSLKDVAEGRRAVAASVSMEEYAPQNPASWADALKRFRKLTGGGG